MDFKVTDNIRETRRQLDEFVDSVRLALFEALENDIKAEVVRQVTDNSNWNPRAVYKGGPQMGQRYDLEETGRMMEVIRNPNYNTVGVMPSVGNAFRSTQMRLGVGNIVELDRLVSPRKGRNPRNDYWRLVVFGRDAIPGWHFVQIGEGPGKKGIKPVGFAATGGEIAPSEPTYMFDNGLKVAQKAFPQIIQRYMKRTEGGKKR